jgi:hypothetical protein
MTPSPQQLRIAADIIENKLSWEIEFPPGHWILAKESPCPLQAIIRGNTIRKAAPAKPLKWAAEPEPVADPYAELKAAHARGEPVECQSVSGEFIQLVGFPSWKAPIECYRIKPAPQYTDLGPDDVDATCEFLSPGGDTYQWTIKNGQDVWFAGLHRAWATLKTHGWKYRRPGQQWEPCRKEVAQ